MINGAGAYLYIGDRDDKKFSNKKFKEMCYEDEEFYDILTDTAIKVLKEMISYNNGLSDSLESKPVRRLTTSAILNKLDS